MFKVVVKYSDDFIFIGLSFCSWLCGNGFVVLSPGNRTFYVRLEPYI